MNCTQAEFDAFVAEHMETFDRDGHPIDEKEADILLSTIIDLFWPDTPYGFTNEQFIESWNRQLKDRKRGGTNAQDTDSKKE